MFGFTRIIIVWAWASTVVVFTRYCHRTVRIPWILKHQFFNIMWFLLTLLLSLESFLKFLFDENIQLMLGIRLLTSFLISFRLFGFYLFNKDLEHSTVVCRMTTLSVILADFFLVVWFLSSEESLSLKLSVSWRCFLLIPRNTSYSWRGCWSL